MIQPLAGRRVPHPLVQPRDLRSRAIPVVRALFWVIAVSGIAGATAHGQVKGAVVRVRDQNQSPVPHALVEVEGGRGRVTDDSGRVVLDLAVDTTRASVRRIGHAPFSGPLVRGASGEFEVTLRAFAQTLTAVSVIAIGTKSPLENAGFYGRMLRAQRGAFTAEFILPEELDSRPTTRVSDLLQGRRFLKVNGSGRGAFLIGRGGCKVNVFVDGMLLRPSGRQDNNPVYINEFVDAATIAAIEMYASAAQAPIELLPPVGATQRDAGACGIVAIWTGGRR